MKKIHLGWEGPFGLEAVKALDNWDYDFGLYQVYGPHPIYCSIQLLYIGRVVNQPFALRIPKHWWTEHTRDPSQNSIYVGRLLGASTPDNETWSREIVLAESLLIYAHYPTYNKQKDPGKTKESDLKDLQVLNWGSHRDLLPEVSYARLEAMPGDYKRYGSHQPARTTPAALAGSP